MNSPQKQWSKPGFILGAAAIIFVWLLLSLPGIIDRWLYHWYQDQVESYKYASASTVHSKIYGLTPVESHLHYQNLMLEAGEKNEVQQRYNQLAEKHPENATSIALRARVVDDPQLKQDLLKKAERLDPDDTACLTVKIEELLEKSQASEAQAVLQKLKGGSWLKPYLAARIAWDTGQREQADEHFKQALHFKNTPLSVGITYARFLSEKPKKQPDINPFNAWKDEKIQNDPLATAYRVTLSGNSITKKLDSLASASLYNPDSLTVLSRSAIKQGEMNTASKLLKRALRIQPDHVPALAYRGILALEEGDKRRAVSIFSTGLHNVKKDYNKEFHHKFGILLLKEGLTDYAMPHLAKIWGDPTKNLQILKIAGQTQLALGQCEKALKTFEKAKGIRPLDKEVLKGLGQAAKVCGDTAKAISAYADIVNHYFDDMDARDNLARLFAEKGEINRAIALYDLYLQRYPNSGLAYVHVAKIHNNYGNKNKAIQILKNVLQKKLKIKNRELIQNTLKDIQDTDSS